MIPPLNKVHTLGCLPTAQRLSPTTSVALFCHLPSLSRQALWPPYKGQGRTSRSDVSRLQVHVGATAGQRRRVIVLHAKEELDGVLVPPIAHYKQAQSSARVDLPLPPTTTQKKSTGLTNPPPKLIPIPARLLPRRTRPLQPRLVDIEPTSALRRARPAARVDPHGLPGGVEDGVGRRDEGPREVVAEVEDLVLVFDAAGLAVGAVEEAVGGFVLVCGAGGEFVLFVGW